MGHSDSMTPTKDSSSGSASSFVASPSHNGSLEKPAHHDNPVEPVRVKLQDPIGYPSDSLWFSEGLKSRSSLLSQTLSERPANFTLRAPRLKSKTQTTPRSESDACEAVVDNQKEDEKHRASSENSEKLPTSWDSAQNLVNGQPTNNQEVDSPGLPLGLDSESQAVDIWMNPQKFEDDLNSSVGPSLSPPDKQSFPVMARPSLNQTCRGGGTTGGCRVPPGMSLMDRIQEDFPRTPSPEYEHFNGESIDACSAFGGRDQSVFGINEGIGQMRLGNSASAWSYDGGRRSGHDNVDLPQDVPAFDPRFVGVSARCHTFGRTVSELPSGASYQVPMAHGYTSTSYGMAAHSDQSCPVMMIPGKSRLAANKDTCTFPASPFGFISSSFAHPGYSSMADYSVGYGGDIYNMRPTDTMFKVRPSYYPVENLRYESHGSYVPRPHMPYRSKTDFDYFHPVAHSYSSNSLLEEFNLAPKSEKWGLSTIKGHLFIFAKDQTGSRFIQQKLEKADERLKSDAFNEIFPNSLLLMTDVFGNYVIQKFLEYGTLDQQQLLVELMTSNMISLALQVYGCRVIQRALEVTRVEEQLALIEELKGYVMKCVVDQNGNHVLQKCIEAASWKRAAEYNSIGHQRFVTGEDIQFIIDSFVGHAAALSTHSYGCRVIQRVLEHCAPSQIRLLVDEIIYKCRDLVKDQFGNYVVQHVISHGEPSQRSIVKEMVLPEIARWSQHKYASNVVESCLEHSTKEEIRQIIDFILRCDESGASCALLPMMKDMYGNYVVQKLLERADDHDRHRIVCIIRHNEGYLKRFQFGKHVLSRLEHEQQTASSYY